MDSQKPTALSLLIGLAAQRRFISLTVAAANYFSDAADYRVVASNAGGSVTSAVATLILFSTNTDVTLPGDPISAFGVNLFGDGAVSHAIDNDLGQKFGANVSGPCG